MSPSLHLRAFQVALLAAGLGICPLARASGPAPLTLTELTRKAGFIFAGRVLQVQRPAALPGRVPLVQVTFRVERALRGTRSGQTFALNQWAGAWNGGAQYRPGQRLLLFLYPRGPTGLTSVVGGRLGQFDLDVEGNIVLRADQEPILVGSAGPEESPGRTAAAGQKFRYRDFARRIRGAALP